ncbi:MAG: hypothetical protein C0503_02185 [Gemmatimonas sp.]|nr:hypothetical protein [Gemmatimonas sp.]
MRRLIPLAVMVAISAVAGVAGAGSAIPTSSAATRPAETAVPSAHSDSQAELGRRWFAASCEECHAVDEIASADFKAKWGGRTAFDLFEQIARTMPESEPGSLPRRAYVDIVAYLMKQNGVVAIAPLADDDAALAATILQFAPPSVTRR